VAIAQGAAATNSPTNRSKFHLAVDTLGHLLVMTNMPTDTQDRAQVRGGVKAWCGQDLGIDEGGHTHHDDDGQPSIAINATSSIRHRSYCLHSNVAQPSL
jgi:hypothetical protein